MSSLQARETSTASRQTDWSQYISCIRYRIAWLPGGSGFGAVLHPVIVVVLQLLVVDRCPSRMSSVFRQWGSLGRLGWIMRAFYSYYAPRISPTQVDAVGCKVSGPTVRMSIDSTVFLCVCPLREETERLREREKRREREREREREEREIEREREREIEREREREREKERKRKRGERGLPGLAIVSRQAAFSSFLRAKTNHFPANGWRDSALGRGRAHMHAQRRLSWRHHWGRPCTADRMCASSPLSFMVGCVLYVFNVFNAPLSGVVKNGRDLWHSQHLAMLSAGQLRLSEQFTLF